MKTFTLLITVLFSSTIFGQVGIGTTNPKGALDIESATLGLVLPRVTRIEDVTNNNTGLAEDGTIVYDVSRNTTCFRISGAWICIANDASISITVPVPAPLRDPLGTIITEPDRLKNSNRAESGNKYN
jgi:hypothetical protein